MLAKRGYLPKFLLKLQDKPPLCVACQFGTAHQRPWRTKGKKSGYIQKPDQINRVMEYQLIKLYQLNQA
jgi:hypothetical protein